jgi:hypothetical protein
MKLSRKTKGWYYLYGGIIPDRPWHKKLNGRTISYWLRSWIRKLKMEFKDQNITVDWIIWNDGFAFVNSNTGARLFFQDNEWHQGEIVQFERDTMVLEEGTHEL